MITPCMLSYYNNYNSDSGPITIIHLLRSVCSAGLLLCFVLRSVLGYELRLFTQPENTKKTIHLNTMYNIIL